ncbi:MAG: type II toxin-antitoxin system HicA family toxin [Pseudomonadota bacterium]
MSPSRLSSIDGKQAIKALLKLGFEIKRVKCSHHILRSTSGTSRTVVVPVHCSRDLPPGTMRSIIDQAGITEAEFVAVLKRR